MTKIEYLKENITQAEQQLSELKAELEKVETEPTVKRADAGEEYFTVSTDFGEPYVYLQRDHGGMYDNARFDLNNYFLSKERAQEVADKIKFLLKMERYHDIYCPNYTPDWDDFDSGKWYISYDVDDKEYSVHHGYYAKDGGRTYFPDRETAQTVCDKLNSI